MAKTPEQRAAGRQQQRERWAKATPEERAAKRLRDNAAAGQVSHRSNAPLNWNALANMRHGASHVHPNSATRWNRIRREQSNFEWAEEQARLLAAEERARLERRAREWKLRGAAAGIGA